MVLLENFKAMNETAYEINRNENKQCTMPCNIHDLLVYLFDEHDVLLKTGNICKLFITVCVMKKTYGKIQM